MGRLFGGTVAALVLWTAAPAIADSEYVADQVDPAHTGHLVQPAITAPLSIAWTVEAKWTSTPRIALGTVFVVAFENDEQIVQARSQATGQLLWSRQLGGRYSYLRLAIDRGRVFALEVNLAEDTATLTALEISDGSVAWTASVNGRRGYETPVAVNGRVYVVGTGNGGTAWSLRELDGSRVWRSGLHDGSRQATVLDGSVLSSSACGLVTSLDALTGGGRWEKSGPCDNAAAGRFAVATADSVWTVGAGASGYRFDPNDGALLGTFTADDVPAVTASASYLRSGSALGRFAANGAGPALWTFAGDGQLFGPALVADDLVFIASKSGMVYALDTGTGSTSWSQNVGVGFEDDGGWIAPDGLSAANGTLLAMAGDRLTAYRPTSTIGTAPVSVRPPSIGGELRAGQRLVADVGSWAGLPTSYAYHWQRCDGAASGCTPVDDATGAIYTPANDEVGKVFKVAITATNAVSSATATSASPPLLAARPVPVSQTAPTVQGSIARGEYLTADAGTWTDATGYRYAWFRCDTSDCQDIPQATGPTYRLDDNDVRHTVGVRVVASNDTGESAPALSAAVGPLAPPAPELSSYPSAFGDPVVGSPFDADAGEWRYATSYAYGWERCDASQTTCTLVRSAQPDPAYTPTDADLGAYLRVFVTATNETGSTGPIAGSNLAGPVAPRPPVPQSQSPAPPILARPAVTNPQRILPPPPSSKFSSSGKRMTKTGKVYFDETTASPGTFAIRALAVPRDRGASFESGHVTRKVSAGLSHFALKLNDKGAKLFKRGKLAKIRLEVSFLPDRGTEARVQRLTYEIKRKR